MALRNTKKDLEYLDKNPIVKAFVEEVNAKIEKYYLLTFGPLAKVEYLSVNVGKKYIRLLKGPACWGFISRHDGILHGESVKRGDLLKPANWERPAKHSRGNIIDGTARWGVYGPEYL